ncbi:MAG TPA: hypothetical protein VFD66_00240 [Verrucomicrobiae bacterium]|nr:hypothetical protein [Verrucomicrobiae bacterium]
MARGTKAMVLSCFALLTGSLGLSGDVPGNPYQGIVDRNLFNLKPMPRIEDPVNPAGPPPKITLTGFTTILGDKRVLFKIQLPAKPPNPTKDQSFIMTEGQRDDDIEVLQIDEKAGVAKFNNHGTIQTLDLATDGTKPPNVPPPIAMAPPARPFSSLSGRIPQPPPADPAAANQTVPTRTVRIPPVPTDPGSRIFRGNAGLRQGNATQ